MQKYSRMKCLPHPYRIKIELLQNLAQGIGGKKEQI